MLLPATCGAVMYVFSANAVNTDTVSVPFSLTIFVDVVFQLLAYLYAAARVVGYLVPLARASLLSSANIVL